MSAEQRGETGARGVRVVSVVGARPQFVKLAPVDRALRERGHEHVIVHTGQHYDRLLSQAFFDDLAISEPDVNLRIGPAGPAGRLGAILTRLDPVLAGAAPDWVLVYGDTDSTLGGALAAAQRQLPLAHLEAGVRSFDRRMAEERNRVVTDHVSDLLLAPSPAAVRHAAGEGLAARTVLTGDVMADVLAATRAQVAAAPGRHLPPGLRTGPYLLATIHRAETTDDDTRLTATLRALAGLPVPVRLLAHPRLAGRAARLALPLSAGAVRALDPLPYPAMVAALLACDGLVTDSGGLQKEALLLGVPCTTLRPVTEWPETLPGGWNVLVPDPRDLAAAVARPRPAGPPPRPYGDGAAAPRVVAELAARAGVRRPAGVAP